MSNKPKVRLDPLFQLFEHYLFHRSYEDTATFTREIAEEYMEYLDSTPAHVPYHTRENLLKDLESEAHELLVKKMYGCVTSTEYNNTGNVVELRKDIRIWHEFTPREKNEEPQK